MVEVPFEEPILRTHEGMAVHKGDLELLGYLNQWIKANRTDGWLGAVRRHWFDSLDWRRRE
jgi:ABC-type amino acid transport substrate-binding protein